METKISYTLISSLETHAVRHAVLRAGKPISSCIFDGDDTPTTIHIGGFYKNKLIAVVSLFKKKNEAISSTNAYQLRGMAVLEKYQGQGHGRKIIAVAETILEKKNVFIVWMNARESAIPFYINSGYSKFGPIFDIPDVGLHQVMYKKLNS